MILPKRDFLKQITIEDISDFIEKNNFKPHAVQYDGSHYCKNIKYHSIRDFTEKEKDVIFDEKQLNEIWDFIIIPAIESFKEETGYDIHTKGRMGGWIYCDEAKAEEDDIFQEKQEHEDDEDYEQRCSQVKTLFRALYEFQQWYEQTVETIKEYIQEEKEVD